MSDNYLAGKIAGLEIAARQVEKAATEYFIAEDDETAKVIRDLAVWIRGEQEFQRSTPRIEGETEEQA